MRHIPGSLPWIVHTKERRARDWIPEARGWYSSYLILEIIRGGPNVRPHEAVAWERIRAADSQANLAELIGHILPPAKPRRESIVRYERLLDHLEQAAKRGDERAGRNAYKAFSNPEDVGAFEEIWRLARAMAHRRADAVAERQRRAEEIRRTVQIAVEDRRWEALELLAASGPEEREIVAAGIAPLVQRVVRARFPNGDRGKEVFLTSMARTLLLKARAGSGKTTAVAMKAA